MSKWFVCLLVLTAGGCSKEKPPLVMQSASGRVIYNGTPAAGVKVYLLPTSAPMVPEVPNNPHGLTGPDGQFTVGTFTDSDGAGEGGYQVVLLWPAENKAENQEESDEDRLNEWYTAANSLLSCQIKAGKNEIPTFHLPLRNGKPPASNGIPGRN